MFKAISSMLGWQKPEEATRRKYVRNEGGASTVVIGNSEFSVENWSRGGILFTANDDNFNVGEDINFTMNFPLPHSKMNINHQGKVVRSANGGVAAEFAPMGAEAEQQMNRVMDGYISEGFIS